MAKKKSKAKKSTTLPVSVSCPSKSCLGRADKIINSSLISCRHFLNKYNQSRKGRSGGSSTDEEQDLLRAMLSFAAAGLDAMIKQTIKDCLSIVIQTDPGAQQEFTKFVERYLKKRKAEEVEESIGVDLKKTASILVAESPRQYLIEAHVKELRSNSLQSQEGILKAASAFGIGINELDMKLIKDCQKLFKARNEIIHEMDVLFGQINRSRIQRTKSDMVNWTSILFKVAENFLQCVGEKIQEEP